MATLLIITSKEVWGGYREGGGRRVRTSGGGRGRGRGKVGRVGGERRGGDGRGVMPLLIQILVCNST